MSEGRCTGHCCRKFPLPYSLEELNEGKSRETGRPLEPDWPFIADMVILLGEGKYGDGRKSYLYTCRHLDTVTGDCTVYEQRPRMCRDYPYGNECPIDGCTAPDRGVTLAQLKLKPFHNLKPDLGES